MTVSLEEQKSFISLKSNSLIFYFMVLDFCVLRDLYLFFTPLFLLIKKNSLFIYLSERERAQAAGAA